MAGDTIKMLSIDDKTVTTDLDRAGYRKMGVYVKAATNFEEANKLLNTEEIDLIVINMDHPPIDSLQITKHLKSLERFRETPIILTSVRTSAKVRNAALGAGADLFVEQPLPRQYFIEKLKQLLAYKTRTTERVDVKSAALISYNGQKMSCPIGDLSISGILLSTDMELDSGTTLVVEFELPGYKKMLSVEGEVVRTIKFSSKYPDRQTGVGIRFVDFNGDSKKRLEKYIEKYAHDDTQMQYYL